MMTRRTLLQFGGASLLAGCVNIRQLQPNCPLVDWSPSLIAPVFYGYTDFGACGCPSCTSCIVSAPSSSARVVTPPVAAPQRPGMRVYFPTLDGSPQNATILTQCERFPLVLLIHGDCGGDPIAQWDLLPAQLARCGFVVAVTQAGGFLAQNGVSDLDQFLLVEQWLRNDWEHSDRVMPAPNTAVIGHSYGGTLAAELATQTPVMALATLSATFFQSNEETSDSFFASIKVPSLFCWNDQDDAQVDAALITSSIGNHFWDDVGTPKHAVIFRGSHHGDYLVPNSAPRCPTDGACRRARQLAADFVTTFIAKYVHPEFDFAAFTYVPSSLFVRPQDLPHPPQNGFYAGGLLGGFAQAATATAAPSDKSCVQQVMWQTSWSQGSTFVVSA